MLNKKGQGEQQQIILLAEFLLGIIVVSILVYGAYQAGAKEQFHRAYITTDTGLILESIYSVPGNVEIEMKIGDDKHDVIIGKDKEFNYYKVLVDGQEIGLIGEVHPQVLENFGMEMPIVMMELNLTLLYELVK